jgi:hypothetical protein
MKRNTLFLFLIVLLSGAIGFLFGSRQLTERVTVGNARPSIQKLNKLIT